MPIYYSSLQLQQRGPMVNVGSSSYHEDMTASISPSAPGSQVTDIVDIALSGAFATVSYGSVSTSNDLTIALIGIAI